MGNICVATLYSSAVGSPLKVTHRTDVFCLEQFLHFHLPTTDADRFSSKRGDRTSISKSVCRNSAEDRATSSEVPSHSLRKPESMKFTFKTIIKLRRATRVIFRLSKDWYKCFSHLWKGFSRISLVPHCKGKHEVLCSMFLSLFAWRVSSPRQIMAGHSQENSISKRRKLATPHVDH